MFIFYLSLSSGDLTSTSSQICGSWYLPIFLFRDGSFAERFREHMKAPSHIYDHFNITGHEVSLDNFCIVGREDQSLARTIREAILIRVSDPSLIRNIGKYQLPHIWDEVLIKSPELNSNKE